MSYELIALTAGVTVGALAVYAFLSRQMISKAQLIATRLFEIQRNQLDHAIRQEYEAKLAEWRGIELASTIRGERKDAIEKARAVLKGRIGEQIAPMLPEFLSNFNPADARFIGSPIDYIVFRNLSEAEDQVEVVLLDIKTGGATLSGNERRIEESIKKGRVRFQTLNLGNMDEKRTFA